MANRGVSSARRWHREATRKRSHGHRAAGGARSLTWHVSRKKISRRHESRRTITSVAHHKVSRRNRAAIIARHARPGMAAARAPAAAGSWGMIIKNLVIKLVARSRASARASKAARRRVLTSSVKNKRASENVAPTSFVASGSSHYVFLALRRRGNCCAELIYSGIAIMARHA